MNTESLDGVHSPSIAQQEQSDHPFGADYMRPASLFEAVI